jgi:hypothetical protein
LDVSLKKRKFSVQIMYCCCAMLILSNLNFGKQQLPTNIKTIVIFKKILSYQLFCPNIRGFSPKILEKIRDDDRRDRVGTKGINMF